MATTTRQLRLLERIRRKDPRYHEEQLDEAQRTIDSVKGYVQHILNTRQGSAILGDRFGIPDFSAATMNFSVTNRYELESKIRKLIEEFEPRLGNLKVTLEGMADPTEGLLFRIEGSVGEENPLHVDFDTIVNGEGKIYLRDIQA